MKQRFRIITLVIDTRGVLELYMFGILTTRGRAVKIVSM